jgi:hypothetical protein
MNAFRKIALAAAAVLTLTAAATGCRKFLEPKSQSEFSPTEIDQLNELLLTALMDPYNTAQQYMLTGGFLDVLSDDVQTLQQFIAPLYPGDVWYEEGATVYGLYTWQPNYAEMATNRGSDTHGKMYSDIYNKLTYANSVLDYVDRVEGTREMKDYVTAQARALRAFYYLHLVNMFGVPYNVDPDGPGVPLRTTGARENRKMVRNTVGEVYALVEEDLLAAVELFDAIPETYRFREYRPSQPMALLLLARAYLYMENWEKAEFYAERLIEEWPRFQMLSLASLVADGKTNVDPAAETTTDSTVRRVQRFYNDFVSYENPDVIWPYGSARDAIALTGKVFRYASGSAPRVVRNGQPAVLTLASPDLVGSYADDDLRLRTYFVRDLFSEPNYKDEPFDPSKAVYRAYGKLEMSAVSESLVPLMDTHFGYSLRVTEAWLILAEAQAMLGKQAEALATLAKIWDNRFAGGSADAPAAYKGGDVVDAVRAERRRELCFESLRWFDLRRWGMHRMEHVWYDTRRGTRQVYVLEQDDRGFTLPMPDYLLNKNPDLTQVPLAHGGGPRPAES